MEFRTLLGTSITFSQIYVIQCLITCLFLVQFSSIHSFIHPKVRLQVKVAVGSWSTHHLSLLLYLPFVIRLLSYVHDQACKGQWLCAKCSALVASLGWKRTGLLISKLCVIHFLVAIVILIVLGSCFDFCCGAFADLGASMALLIESLTVFLSTSTRSLSRWPRKHSMHPWK